MATARNGEEFPESNRTAITVRSVIQYQAAAYLAGSFLASRLAAPSAITAIRTAVLARVPEADTMPSTSAAPRPLQRMRYCQRAGFPGSTVKCR